jgi:putative transposase
MRLVRKTADLARRHCIWQATLYNSKAEYDGVDLSQAKRLRTLKNCGRCATGG